MLHQYPFIGNIRELKNIAERADVLKTGDIITKKNLQDALYPPDLETESEPIPRPVPEDTLWVSEPERLRHTLEQCGGNRTLTAKLLDMDRSTLWRKMKKYGLQ